MKPRKPVGKDVSIALKTLKNDLQATQRRLERVDGLYRSVRATLSIQAELILAAEAVANDLKIAWGGHYPGGVEALWRLDKALKAWVEAKKSTLDINA